MNSTSDHLTKHERPRVNLSQLVQSHSFRRSNLSGPQAQMYLFLLAFCFLDLTCAQNCEDLVDFCDALQPVCIGSIIQYHSSLPALEDSLPLIRSEGTSDTASGIPETNITELEKLEQGLKDSLPLLKESLPLIRESLPLIRESLPLIRHIIDPTYYNTDKTTCQQKATCKSCRECPKLREAVTALVESICPNTCRLCATGNDS
ncbi:hypothetical protein RB195_021104 [Necator americanus]|uniref:ShKT domain-containing protein n=1 Tax=Necator americanus TaxID=51031 RepID=A0ABR1E9E1_NECAM